MATYQSILDASIALLCEDASNGDCEDYKSRAIYILAILSSECLTLDRRLRTANGDDTVVGEIPVAINLSDTFPLCSDFIPAATYYLSAMLVVDENEKLSDKFFDLYSDALASIQASIPESVDPSVPENPDEDPGSADPDEPSAPPPPAELESIVNRYVGSL